MKSKLPKTIKRIIIWVIIAGLGVAGYFAFMHFRKPKVEAAITVVTVDRGPIEVSISGSGQIEPNQKYEVQALVKGEIIADPFTEGMDVSQGTLLYKINTSDAESNIEKQKIALQKTQDTYDQNKAKLEKLTLTSKYSGTITNLYVKLGDDIKSDTKIADVVDNSKMILKIPFITDDVSSIYLGLPADVSLVGSGYSVSGTVSKVATGTSVSSEGVQITEVEIIVQNPGALKKDDRATAIVNSIACNDTGVFDYYETGTILSESEGKIEFLPFSQNDEISVGAVVLRLSSESLNNTLKSNELDLKSQNLSLANEQNNLKDYSITSPISGTVIQKTSKKGDILDNSTSKVVMATIADMSKIIFKMNVDELDIDKVKVGQAVSITADALPNVEFDGYVEYKNIIGTSANGVTSYPVTIVINDPDGLIPGMNVNAKVIVERVDDVVRIPVSALRRGNMVQVKLKPGEKAPESPSPGQAANGANRVSNGGAVTRGGGTGEGTTSGGGAVTRGSGNMAAAPEGYKNVMVRAGLNDKDYVEIIEGIKEDDEVVVPTVSTVPRTTLPQMGGMGGGMGGAAPAGGGVRINTGGGGAPAGGGNAPRGGGG